MATLYNIDNAVIDKMIRIYKRLKNESFFLTHDVTFDHLLNELGFFFDDLDKTEIGLFTYIFVMYIDWNKKPVSLSILAEDAQCIPISLLAFEKQFASLKQKNYIFVEDKGDNYALADYYRVNENVIKAIINQDKRLLKNLVIEEDYNFIRPEKTAEKELFYPAAIKKDIERLEQILESDNLLQIQQRLVSKKLAKGFCVCLSGDSGTGKTETVYQLAKKTGRAVYRVDIGSTVSCWHSGTIMNLKKIFEKYENYCKTAKERNEEIPILFFNEADALFGKRNSNPMQGAEIDENHTQNFLLDYLEKQEGIIIATTNMVSNFDLAFERRFLFKIEFEKPDLEIKKKIWKNKAAWLTKKSVEHLASSYSLSGAQIDNVVRKATMDEVITGKHCSMKAMEDYCKHEKLGKNDSGKIGFNQ